MAAWASRARADGVKTAMPTEKRTHFSCGSQFIVKIPTATAVWGLRTGEILQNPGDPEKGERSSLFRVLARTPFNSCVRPLYSLS